MVPEARLVARFAGDLDALIPPGRPIGLAVSGGHDSMALLLLAAAARPGLVEAATVDHGLRPEAADEARLVGTACTQLGVPHRTLVLSWDSPPDTAIQERARVSRYAALSQWLDDRSLAALTTGHHRDDQAETLLMRLNRGAGVAGLSGIRGKSTVPGDPGKPLLRPLLGWKRDELVQICAEAGVPTADDPSNRNERFERVRVRALLAGDAFLDPAALARSAAHLSEADRAIDWAVEHHWAERVTETDGRIDYDPSDAPGEIRRRTVAAIIVRLATEGSEEPLRGRDLDRLMGQLEAGSIATLRGVHCNGGAAWTFVPAPKRRGSAFTAP